MIRFITSPMSQLFSVRLCYSSKNAFDNGTGANAQEPRIRCMLLHNWKLQNPRLWVLHEDQALQGFGLCCFFPTILLEGDAGLSQ